MIKQTQPSLKMNRFISSHTLQSTVKGSEGQSGRNLEQDLKQRPWRKVAYWLTPIGLLSLLSQ